MIGMHARKVCVLAVGILLEVLSVTAPPDSDLPRSGIM